MAATISLPFPVAALIVRLITWEEVEFDTGALVGAAVGKCDRTCPARDAVAPMDWGEALAIPLANVCGRARPAADRSDSAPNFASDEGR